jgi:cyanophycin synthetase
MFAVAMAWGSGVDDERIAAALATFTNDFETLPGRFNVYRGLPFNVVLDYGHNAAGFERVVEAVDGLQTTGRRIVVVGLAGDRRDDDVRAAARVLAPAFDHFVCRGESDLRGRAPGELPRVMARSLVEAGVAPHDVIQVDDELEATRVALHVAVPGDLVIVFGVQLENTWGLIRGFVPTATEHRPDLLVRRSRERAPAAQGRARWGVAPPEPGTRTEP